MGDKRVTKSGGYFKGLANENLAEIFNGLNSEVQQRVSNFQIKLDRPFDFGASLLLLNARNVTLGGVKSFRNLEHILSSILVEGIHYLREAMHDLDRFDAKHKAKKLRAGVFTGEAGKSPSAIIEDAI